MSPYSYSVNSATLRQVSCFSCESHTTVSFGPFGFMSKCAGCGAAQHLDDLLEPVSGISSFRSQAHSFADGMLASA